MSRSKVSYNNSAKRKTGVSKLLIQGEARVLNSKPLKEILSLKGYTAKDDLDLILQLYKLGGETSLRLIEGYFAFLIQDRNQLFVARDIYGVKPFYAGGNDKKVLTSSRIKPLLEIKPTWIEWIPPGSILKIYNGKKLEKKFYQLSTKYPAQFDTEELLNYIVESIKLEAQKLKKMKIKKVGIPLSGGVDSSTLAVLGKKYIASGGIKIIAVSSGVVGSEDLEYAKKVAAKYKIPLKIKIIKKDEILSLIKNVVHHLEGYNSNLVTNAIGKYVTAHLGKSLGISIFICADSIDEQLWGYHLISPYSKECKKYFSQFSSPEEAWIDIFANCYKTEGKLLDSMNKSAGIESWLPYLYQKLVEYNINLPSKYKVKKVNGKTVVKWALRKAVSDILSKEIAFRPKMPQRLGGGLQNLVNEVVEETVGVKEFKKMQTELKAKGYSIHDKLEVITFRYWSKEFDPDLSKGKMLNKFNLYPMVGYW